MEENKIIFTESFHKGLKSLKKEDKRLLGKLMELIANTALTPLSGLGKPKPLSGNLQDYWSRRIDDKHRLIYAYNEDNQEVTVISCFGRYDDL